MKQKYKYLLSWFNLQKAESFTTVAPLAAVVVTCQLQTDTAWVQYGARPPAAAPMRA